MGRRVGQQHVPQRQQQRQQGAGLRQAQDAWQQHFEQRMAGGRGQPLGSAGSGAEGHLLEVLVEASQKHGQLGLGGVARVARQLGGRGSRKRLLGVEQKGAQ